MYFCKSNLISNKYIYRLILLTKKILRIAGFGTFLGHGIVAISGNPAWIPLLTSFGFSVSFSTYILPYIGILDIIVAFLLLFYPLRFILIWATLWAFMTAISRPIAGYPIWAFVERFANWLVPLALLSLQGFPKDLKSLFKIN